MSGFFSEVDKRWSFETRPSDSKDRVFKNPSDFVNKGFKNPSDFVKKGGFKNPSDFVKRGLQKSFGFCEKRNCRPFGSLSVSEIFLK